MRLYSIPYYIDLEGQEINGIILKPYHVKLLGIIIVHDKLGNGCFASTETLAEEAKLTVGTVKNARADLIKTGIIRAEKDNFGNIKALIVNEVEFQGWVNHSLPYGQPQLTPQVNHSLTASREATPVLNKNIKKNIKGSAYASSANADSAQAPQSSSANASSDKNDGASSSSPIGSSSPFIKDESSLPFDEELEEVHSVKPKRNKNSSAKAGVIYSKICNELGIRVVTSNCTVARIRSLLSNGMTEDDILGAIRWTKTDEFYAEGSILMRLSDDAIQKYQVYGADKKQRRNNNNATSEVIF